MLKFMDLQKKTLKTYQNMNFFICVFNFLNRA